MSGNATINLDSFYIYNSKFGDHEGEEHKKILFYHPKDADTDEQIRSVGLCEAVIKFTETFNPSKKCEAMHTQKSKQFFFQPEEDYWMVMTIGLSVGQRVKDGQQSADCYYDDVQDSVFLSVLRISYLMFRFFQGTYKSLWHRLQVDGLKQKLSNFYSRYLLNLRLGQADLLDVFNGVCFLPLDKNTFLRVHCFVNLIEATIPQVKYLAFLYNEQLVWSGLEQEDMQILYKYLISSLYPSYLETELQPGLLSPTRQNLPSFTLAHYGKFVTGPQNLNDPSNVGKVPKVHINVASKEEECHLVVYRALSASVCLLIDSSFQLNFDFYKRLDSFLGSQLTSLASHISEVYTKNSTSTVAESQFKYVYFNHMNLAQKSTIHVGLRSNLLNIPMDVMRLLTDISVDLNKLDRCGEVFVKTVNDFWVVGKMSDERELYVVIDQKSANLIEVNGELKKLCSAHFENIFYVD